MITVSKGGENMTPSDKKALTALLEMIAELISADTQSALELIKLYIDELKS